MEKDDAIVRRATYHSKTLDASKASDW